MYHCKVAKDSVCELSLETHCFYCFNVCRVTSEAEDLTLAVLVNLDLQPPRVDNGTITQFDIYLGTVDARNQSASIRTATITNKVEVLATNLFSCMHALN